MDLEEIGINAGNLVDSAQDRDYWRALVNAALNLWVSWAMELVIISNETLLFKIPIMFALSNSQYEKTLKYNLIN